MSTPGLKSDPYSVKIAVIGPGAIGGFLTALLAKRGYDVLCVGRANAVSEIRDRGLSIESPVFGNFTVYPSVSADLRQNVDIIFLAVKSPDLRSAAEKISHFVTEDTIIIPLQNGIEHLEILRTQLNGKIVPAVIGGIAAEKVDTNRIVTPSSEVFMNVFFNHQVAPSMQLNLAKILKDIGIRIGVMRSEEEVMWSKLARLSVIAGVTAAAGDDTLGVLRRDVFWRKKIKCAAKEVAAIANREGVSITEAELLDQIDSLPYNLTTSLQRDTREGNPLEADAILGSVIRRAQVYSLPHDTFSELFTVIMKKSRT